MAHNPYKRGSEWRKWDLHTHTPYDVEWLGTRDLSSGDDKKKFAHDYIQFALKQGLSLIAITDHNFGDNIDDLLLPYIQQEAKRHQITILPGFEITANEGSGVHFLVIFPENTPLTMIKSIVDQLFPPGVAKKSANVVPHSSKSIEQIREIINQSRTNFELIFAHADREKGVLHNDTIRGQMRIDLWQNKNIKICQLSKSPSEFTANFYATVIDGSNTAYKREMTYIIASDCRSVDEDTSVEGRAHLGEKFVWIKADPTINGLKQIIYEPDRVKIQDLNPQDDFRKPYFSKISINEDTSVFKGKSVKFDRLDLLINPNMVAIIGGRGTGKSLILDAVGKTFGYGSKRAGQIETDKNFIVNYVYEDGSSKDYSIHDQNNLDYLHVHQGEVKDIVENTYLLDQEIKTMLGFIETNDNEAFETELTSAINRAIDFKDWLEQVGRDDELVNNREYNQALRKRYEDLLSNITVEKNKELIMKFSSNNAEIATRDTDHNRLMQIIVKIQGFISDINSDIGLLNKWTIPAPMPLFEASAYLGVINQVLRQHNEIIKQLQSDNEAIRQQFLQMGIKEDIPTLLQRVGEYQIQIEKYKNKLDEIEEREKKYPELIQKRIELTSKIKEDLLSKVELIYRSWRQLRDGKEGWSAEQRHIINLLLRDIEVYADVFFDTEQFYEVVCSYLSRTRFKSTKAETSEERIRNCINVDTFEQYLDLLMNKPVIDIGEQQKITLEQFINDSGYFIKNGDNDFLRSLYEGQYRKKYLTAITKIKYKGKQPTELSVGQRGTLYICLKLATNPFSTPFVFDQPEDDLDNQFIVQELIPIFKGLKQYRQIIIATHNANLVVNADAEQVIVASNDGEILSYISGSLENTFRNESITEPLLGQGIREHVCDILEGGERAFEKRERKYGLK